MTLQELFDLLAQHRLYVACFFLLIPFTAWLTGYIAKGEGHLWPWRYVYATLIYLACIPGIFGLMLSVYFFLFERKSILQTDLLSQVLPVITMVITLVTIRKNVNLDDIPGFEKLSGLIWMIAATLSIMWFIDRTRIYVISYMPFPVAIGIFLALLLLIRLGWARFFGRASEGN
jgi:hypothetical protein